MKDRIFNQIAAAIQAGGLAVAPLNLWDWLLIFFGLCVLFTLLGIYDRLTAIQAILKAWEDRKHLR